MQFLFCLAKSLYTLLTLNSVSYSFNLFNDCCLPFTPLDIYYIYLMYYYTIGQSFFLIFTTERFGFSFRSPPFIKPPHFPPFFAISDCYIKLLKLESVSFDNNHQITFHLLFASRPVFRILIISTTFTHPSVSSINKNREHEQANLVCQWGRRFLYIM